MSKPRLTGMKVNPDDIEFESMIFYITWYEQLKECGDDFFLKAVKELCEYSFHGVIPDNSNDPLMNMFFNMAKGSIDANIKLRIAGKKGGETRRNNKASEEEPKEKKPRGRKKKEDSEPEVKEERPLTPKEESEAMGFECVDEDGCYPMTPHNLEILRRMDQEKQ